MPQVGGCSCISDYSYCQEKTAYFPRIKSEAGLNHKMAVRTLNHKVAKRPFYGSRHICARYGPLSSGGPGRTRTYDQKIMSLLL